MEPVNTGLVEVEGVMEEGNMAVVEDRGTLD